MITDDERKWLLEGFPINSSTAAIAVPQSKLRELFDCRERLSGIDAQRKRFADRIFDLEKERDTLKSELEDLKLARATDLSAVRMQQRIEHLEAKLAEVEAERDEWKRKCLDAWEEIEEHDLRSGE